VDVVLNVEPLSTVGSSRATLGDVTQKPVLRALDLVGRVLVVVVGVDIEVDDVVTERSHIGLALTSAAGVRRAHVGGDLANNVAESHLVLPHLLLAVDGRDSAEVQMGPCVGRELMALGVHALEHGRELWGDINLALVDVVASDEESGLCVVLFHEVQDVGSKDLLWTVIVGESNSSGCNAVVNTLAAVGNVSKLGASNGGCVCSSRCNVLWASWSVGIVAARGVTEIVISAAVYE
jgi:hypothetical protein